MIDAAGVSKRIRFFTSVLYIDAMDENGRRSQKIEVLD